MKKKSFLISAMAMTVIFCGTASAQTTEFNYQGSLKGGVSSANGIKKDSDYWQDTSVMRNHSAQL